MKCGTGISGRDSTGLRTAKPCCGSLERRFCMQWLGAKICVVAAGSQVGIQKKAVVPLRNLWKGRADESLHLVLKVVCI